MNNSEQILDNVRKLLVKAVNKDKTAIVNLLNKSGIMTSIHDTKEKIQQQIVKGLALSKNFREKLQNYLSQNHIGDISPLVASYNSSIAKPTIVKNFVSQPMYMESLPLESNFQPTHDPSGFFAVHSFAPNTPYVKPNVYQNVVGDSTTTTTTDTKPKSIIDWLNTALGLYTTSVQNNVATEQQKIVAAQSQADIAKANTSQSYVLPITLGILVVGAGIAVWYYKFHKK